MPVFTEEGSINVSSTMNDGGVVHPSLYLLNPTGLSKPHAIDQLRIDVTTCKPVIMVIVESWFKAHHLDSGFIISDYSLFRLDRKKRRGGGVAIYCHNNTDAKPYFPKVQRNPSFEILWVQIVYHSQLYIIGGLYHPPKPIYDTKELLSYLTNVLEEVYVLPENPIILLAGDFNQLSFDAIPTLGLLEAFVGPTHMCHALDRIYTSQPIYSVCATAASTIKTKHSAVFAASSSINQANPSAEGSMKSFTLRSPSALAALQTHLASVEWNTILPSVSVEESFAYFYDTISEAINKTIPTKTVTIRPRDPKYMTPYVKYLIRKRNSLQRRNKKEAADALAKRIGDCIARFNSSSFKGLERGTRKLWDEVRRVSGDLRSQDRGPAGVTCDTLNPYYQNISTEPNYVAPKVKSTVNQKDPVNFEEFQVFKCLERFRGSSIGPDGIPAWILSKMAHLLALPVKILFERSIASSYVPPQWLSSCLLQSRKSLTPALNLILDQYPSLRF